MSSKSTVLVTIALLAIALLIGFRYFVHNAYKAFPSGPTFDPKPAPYSDWKEFKSPTGKFSVKLPLVPQQASQTFTDPTTKQSRYYDMYVSQEPDGTSYLVSAVALEDKTLTSNPKVLFQTILDDMVKSNKNNKLLSSNYDDFDAQPGLGFVIKNPETTMQGQAFLDNQTLYILAAIDNNNNFKPEDFKYFLKSFELNK